MKGGASLALRVSLELWNSDKEIYYDTLGLTKYGMCYKLKELDEQNYS